MAVYNLARLLRTGDTRGGYDAQWPRLARETGWQRGEGAYVDRIERAARREISRGGWQLVCGGVDSIGDLVQGVAPLEGILVGILAFRFTGCENGHVSAWWVDWNRSGLWAANVSSDDPAGVPLFLRQGTTWWPTLYVADIESEGLEAWIARPKSESSERLRIGRGSGRRGSKGS